MGDGSGGCAYNRPVSSGVLLHDHGPHKAHCGAPGRSMTVSLIVP
jgi:hypothetical protein